MASPSLDFFFFFSLYFFGPIFPPLVFSPYFGLVPMPKLPFLSTPPFPPCNLFQHASCVFIMQHNENNTPITNSGTPAATSGDGSPECGLPGAGGVFSQSSPPGGSPIASGLGAMESSKAATNTLVPQSPPGGRTLALSEANTNINTSTDTASVEIYLNEDSNEDITRHGHRRIYVVSDSEEESNATPQQRRRSNSSPNLPSTNELSQLSQLKTPAPRKTPKKTRKPYKSCEPFLDPKTGKLVVGYSKRGNVYYDEETPQDMHIRTTRSKTKEALKQKLLQTPHSQRSKVPVNNEVSVISPIFHQAETDRTRSTSPIDHLIDHPLQSINNQSEEIPVTPNNLANNFAISEDIRRLQEENFRLQEAARTTAKAHNQALRKLQAENTALRNEMAALRSSVDSLTAELQKRPTASSTSPLPTASPQNSIPIADLTSTIQNIVNIALEPLKKALQKTDPPPSRRPTATVNSNSTTVGSNGSNTTKTNEARHPKNNKELTRIITSKPNINQRTFTSVVQNQPASQSSASAAHSSIEPSKRLPDKSQHKDRDGTWTDVKSRRWHRRRLQRNSPTSASDSAQAEPTPSSLALPLQNTQKPLRPQQHKDNSVLLLPVKPTDLTDQQQPTSILEALRSEPSFDPLALDIRRHIPFANGAVLLQCGSKGKADELRTQVNQIPAIAVKKYRAVPIEIRIHSVPKAFSEDQLKLAIQVQLGEAPLAIRFVPYSRPLQADTHMVVANVTPPAYLRAQKKSSLYLGLHYCPLKTEPYLSRCPDCGLLGHKKQNCKPEAPLAETPPENECKDCHSYNRYMRSANLGGRRLRPTNHKTDDRSCPTRLYFYRRALPVLPTIPAGGAVSTHSHGE